MLLLVAVYGGGRICSCSIALDDDLQNKLGAFDDHEYSLQKYTTDFLLLNVDKR